jgi:nucleoside-diphosphate-sugar epimerase
MRVLVLGGTGLISTGITRELLARGDRVTLFTRGSTRPGMEAVHGDRADVTALQRAWGDGHDAVIDMLCYTPDDARAAIQAFRGRAGHYIMCGTVDVYSKPARYLPVDERHERAPAGSFRYAHDKARCEEILLHSGLPLTILRPAATYLDTAVPSIGSFDLAVERLAANRPVILHGDGGSRWVACHRDDVARAFVAATRRAPQNRAYNVTGHEALTFEGYWHAVADALGVTPTFVKIPADVLGAVAPRAAHWCVENFQHDNVFDCSAAARDLGFASTVPWAEGIARGLRNRVAKPVADGDRAGYEAIVSAWSAATASMRADLLPRNL